MNNLQLCQLLWSLFIKNHRRTYSKTEENIAKCFQYHVIYTIMQLYYKVFTIKENQKPYFCDECFVLHLK